MQTHFTPRTRTRRSEGPEQARTLARLISKVLAATALSLVLASGTAAAMSAPAPGGGTGSSGSSGSSGNTGSSSSTQTVTNVYGFDSLPFNDVSANPNESENIPSFLGLPLATSSSLLGPGHSGWDPANGEASFGVAVAGSAGEAEADESMGVDYASAAPGGVASQVSVTAIVDTVDMAFALGVGESCAPTTINWHPPSDGNSDAVSTCNSTLQVNLPIDDAGSVVSAVLSAGSSAYGLLNQSQRQQLATPNVPGPLGAEGSYNAAWTLMQNTVNEMAPAIDAVLPGASAVAHQSVFNWSSSSAGGR